MLTLKFRLEFDDGKRIGAQIRAESNLEDAPVSYTGPLNRLPLTPARASAIELRAYLQSFARELGAEFFEEVEGMPVFESQEP